MLRQTGTWGLVAAVALTVVLSGCSRRMRMQDEEPKENIMKPNTQAPAQGALRRGAQMQVNKNTLHQMGIFYNMFCSENNRAPTLEELKEFIKRDDRIGYEMLTNGLIVLVPHRQQPGANQVVAYERDAFELHNNRLVLFGDGHVDTMLDPDFQRLMKGN
jgi:hypothetical protein